ncbi:MAG: hypothetical protein H7177_04810 [Rhizobacter sp.]|nr:hypothetical protein [Bacteriovorax sp.]
MADFKLKKISWLRRRFIRSASLQNLNDWTDVYEDLKEQILTSSAFQLVGHKGIIEINSTSGTAHVLLEVVGVPKAGFDSRDIEPQDVLVFDHPENSFSVDFLTLKKLATAIMKGIPGPISDTYHIVFDGLNLSLHFFI